MLQANSQTTGNLNTTNKNKCSSSEVDEITWHSCPKFYTCQTGISFKNLFKQYTRALHNNRKTNSSKFAAHIINMDHKYTTMEESMGILIRNHKGCKLNIHEQFQIVFIRHLKYSSQINEKLNFTCSITFDYI